MVGLFQQSIAERAMIIDTNTSCLNQSTFLKSKGVTAVGRYYRVIHPEWAIVKEEARELSGAGIKIFAVYEDTGHASQFNLTKAQGRADGINAFNQASCIGQPRNGVIYFAVEGLDDGYTSADLPAIRNYFAGVKESIGGRYKIGVYGDGVVCSTLLGETICSYTWLAASTDFEGSRDFYANGPWNLAQKTPVNQTQGWNGLSVDINEARPDFGAFLVPTTGV
jgi:hypothetical protein